MITNFPDAGHAIEPTNKTALRGAVLLVGSQATVNTDTVVSQEKDRRGTAAN